MNMNCHSKHIVHVIICRKKITIVLSSFREDRRFALCVSSTTRPNLIPRMAYYDMQLRM